MATEQKTSFANVLEEARGMMAANPILGPQVEQFWKAQDGILKDVESFSRDWFERRHEAAQTALEAVRKVNGNGADPAAAMRTMMDWQKHSFQRLADDMQQWVELC